MGCRGWAGGEAGRRGTSALVCLGLYMTFNINGHVLFIQKSIQIRLHLLMSLVHFNPCWCVQDRGLGSTGNRIRLSNKSAQINHKGLSRISNDQRKSSPYKLSGTTISYQISMLIYSPSHLSSETKPSPPLPSPTIKPCSFLQW